MFYIRGYTKASLNAIPKIVRARMLKSLAHTIEPFSHVLIPAFDNRATKVLLDFLENHNNYPQYISLVAQEEIEGRPTYVMDNPLELLFTGANYPIYRPLDPAELAYMRIRYSKQSIAFHGIFPFRRVHPRELGAYLLAKGMRFPRKERPGYERTLVKKLEAHYPWLVIPAASFVETISERLSEHVYRKPKEIHPKERKRV